MDLPNKLPGGGNLTKVFIVMEERNQRGEHVISETRQLVCNPTINARSTATNAFDGLFDLVSLKIRPIMLNRLGWSLADVVIPKGMDFRN